MDGSLYDRLLLLFISEFLFKWTANYACLGGTVGSVAVRAA